ncbi:unnamed protein product [Peniophora sp. CBMAI 1063]|nr:unnamed protein product [Peniophora sp. CBMAI 1063]
MPSRRTHTAHAESNASDISGWAYPRSIRAPSGAPGTPLPRDHHLCHAQIVRKLEKARKEQERAQRHSEGRERRHNGGFPVIPSSSSSTLLDPRGRETANAHSDDTLVAGMSQHSLNSSPAYQRLYSHASASRYGESHHHSTPRSTLTSETYASSFSLTLVPHHQANAQLPLHHASYPHLWTHSGSGTVSSPPGRANSANQDYGYTLEYINGQWYPVPRTSASVSRLHKR